MEYTMGKMGFYQITHVWLWFNIIY